MSSVDLNIANTKMVIFKVLPVILVACVVFTSSKPPPSPEPIDGTKLVFAFMILRHGDRTPFSSTTVELLGDSINVTKVNELIAPYGYGQLTKVGEMTGYETGEFIRRRYNDTLTLTFNKSEIYVRSTESVRAMMTVFAAMSAIYPAIGDSRSEKFEQISVPFSTVPLKYDFNTALSNCPVFTTAYYNAIITPNSKMGKHAEVIKKVSHLTGKDITEFPVIVFLIYDLLVSLISLGYDVGNDVKALLPDIKAAADTAWDINAGDEEFIDLLAGPFLNEFFKYANETISGNNTEKMRVYSGHDLNVYGLEAVTRIKPNQGTPKFGSLYSLELRKVVKTGKYVVLPVYLADPHEGVEKFLEVEGCGNLLCDYEKFYNITSPYILDETTWRKKCNFTEDLKAGQSGF